MADQFTYEDLRGILVNRVGIPEEELDSDTDKTFDDLGIDSLGFMEIQHEVELRYGFEVTIEDAQEILTLDDAITYVNRRLQEAS